MKKIIYLTVLILFFSCGGKGVEGNVGQIISISAEENLEETEVDYNWIIVNQPDGSLLSPKDLKYNNNGQEINNQDPLDQTPINGDFEKKIVEKKFPSKKYKIQEVIKPNQVILVQVLKDERGLKGAALTTFISIAGKYIVFWWSHFRMRQLLLCTQQAQI